MTFLETRFYISFNTNLMTMHWRMLGSVFNVGALFHLPVFIYRCACIPPQVPPAPANGQSEGHREDVHPPVRNVSRPQDPHHFDVAYRGAVDHHPQPPVGVSNSRPSAAEPPF